jgi:hypothetical protein
LVVVTDDGDRAMLGGEKIHELILGVIRVLILVHQDMPERALERIQEPRILAHRHHRLHEEVVEVESAIVAQNPLVAAIGFGHRLLDMTVVRGGVLLGRKKTVLGIRDSPPQTVGIQGSDRPRHRIHDALQDLQRIVAVVDGERARIVEALGDPTQDPGGDRVEGADPQPRDAARPVRQELDDPLPHLPGGLVGERHREDVAGIDAVHLDHESHPVGQHPGLPAAGACQDEQRSRTMFDRRALGRIEGGQQTVSHAGSSDSPPVTGSVIRKRAPGRPSPAISSRLPSW